MSSSMANLSFVVGIIGTVLSLLVFASPNKTFRRVVKKKSTENYKGAPYITTFLCTSLWTFYGVLKPGGFLIAAVNGAGAVVHCIYVLLILIYSPQDKKVKTAQLVGILDVGFLGAVISVTQFALHGNTRLTILGMLCSGLTIIMYASPLFAMKTVIKTKSVEYMPFLLSFFMFLNAGVWALYSVLGKDFFVGADTKFDWACIGLSPAHNICDLREEASICKSVDGDLGLGKGDMVMGLGVCEYEDNKLKDGAVSVVEKAFNRVKSLPKPTVTRQYTIRRFLKTLSFGANDLPFTAQDDAVDVEIAVVAEEYPNPFL